MTYALFPKDNVIAKHATLTIGHDNIASLTVDFVPFEFQMPDGTGETQTFDSPLRGDFVRLPSLDIATLSGQTLDFPTNPQDGYIDASVYLMWSHTPVDITRLTFGRLANGTLPLTLTTRWLMTYEGTGFEDFELTINVPMTGIKP